MSVSPFKVDNQNYYQDLGQTRNMKNKSKSKNKDSYNNTINKNDNVYTFNRNNPMNKSQDSFKLTTNKTKDYSPSNFNNEMNESNELANRFNQQNSFRVGHSFAQTNSKFFGQSKKGLEFENNQNPGPGSYEISGKLTNSTLISKVGREKQKFNENPGPGNYEDIYDKVRERSPTYKIGSEKKNTYMGKLSENPGPGNYIIPGLFGVDNSKSNPSFTHEKRKDNFDNGIRNPGPGQYSPSPNQKTGCAFPLTPKGLRFQNNQNPGPGNYEVTQDIKKSGIHHGFGKEQRVLFNLQKGPGPGTYNLDNSKKLHVRPHDC